MIRRWTPHESSSIVLLTSWLPVLRLDADARGRAARVRRRAPCSRVGRLALEKVGHAAVALWLGVGRSSGSSQEAKREAHLVA